MKDYKENIRDLTYDKLVEVNLELRKTVKELEEKLSILEEEKNTVTDRLFAILNKVPIIYL